MWVLPITQLLILIQMQFDVAGGFSAGGAALELVPALAEVPDLLAPALPEATAPTATDCSTRVAK